MLKQTIETLDHTNKLGTNPRSVKMSHEIKMMQATELTKQNYSIREYDSINDLLTS